ncbi:hypothetical protein ACWAT4_21510 [Bradyrhizobium manausense]
MKRILLGLAGATNGNGFCPFLNWWKTAASPTITRTAGGDLNGKAIWDAGVYLDTMTGEIVSPAPADLLTLKRIFFTAPDPSQIALGCKFDGEQWVAKWDGSATGNIDFLTPGNTQDKSVPGQISFTMGSAPGNTQLTLTLTNLNDPPRNVRVYQKRYEPNLNAGEKFNPDWLSEIGKFGILRFMDLQATNGIEIADFSQIADESYTTWARVLTSTSNSGPKGGMPLSLICEIANRTGCAIHVCIPHMATDSFVTSFATYFKNNTSVEVSYEYTNEHWNSSLVGGAAYNYCVAQANAMPGNPFSGDGSKWYGYRASQIMKIIRDVYNDATRWRGVLASQTANISITTSAIAGVNYWRVNVLSPANSLPVNALFKNLNITGYFGQVISCRQITGVTKANPAVVTCNGHGFTNGQRLKLFMDTGMPELNGVFVTVANATTNTFELSGVNSTAYTTFTTGNGNSYAVDAGLFDLMDTSNSNFISNPGTYPTKYSYFNTVMKQLFLTGSAAGLTLSGSLALNRDTWWPQHLAVAQANGLELRQYEGGCHYTTDIFLSGFGGNAQFVEYMVQNGYCQETADVYRAMFIAFIRLGGKMPAKFVEGGLSSRFGTWAGIRYWKTAGNGNTDDRDNPVWAATIDVCQNAQPETYSISW